jgi:hypothetical protein
MFLTGDTQIVDARAMNTPPNCRKLASPDAPWQGATPPALSRPAGVYVCPSSYIDQVYGVMLDNDDFQPRRDVYKCDC